MHAYPEPRFEWAFKGVPIIDQNEKYETNVTALKDDLSVAILRVRNVETSDFGDYMCKATNSIDETETMIRLQPKGPPEPPTQLEAVDVGYDYATIRWIDGFNGGYPNTTFSIYGNKSGSSQERGWDCQQANPCNITGNNAFLIFDESRSSILQRERLLIVI